MIAIIEGATSSPGSFTATNQFIKTGIFDKIQGQEASQLVDYT